MGIAKKDETCTPNQVGQVAMQNLETGQSILRIGGYRYCIIRCLEADNLQIGDSLSGPLHQLGEICCQWQQSTETSLESIRVEVEATDILVANRAKRFVDLDTPLL